MRRVIGLAAGGLALSAMGAGAEPAVTSFTLDNGLEAVVIQDHRAPVVTHMVWYRVGSADEPPGESGIAHFLEHLMFKGTDDIPEGEFSKIIAANGGQDNAFTSLDYTAYFQRIAADRLGLVMEMEADRMRDLLLSESAVETERDVVLEERSQRTDTDPGAKFGEQISAALYLNHPYGVPVIGWRSEIEELDRQDALDFYEAFYGPDNAILVVAGDVTPDQVKALAEEHYGPLERAGVGAKPRPQEPPHLAPRRMSMHDDKVRQPYVTRRYLVPSRLTDEDDEAAALTVLAQVLGGGINSRFTQALEIDQKISISSGAWYFGLARDNTSFGIYGVPAEGVDLATVEAALDAEIARMAAEGPTEDELARARSVIRANEIYAQDSGAGLARRYGAALTVGLTVDEVQSWPDEIASVTAEQVKAAAALLRLESSVTGWLIGPKEGEG
jgi:zinc protease